MNEIAIKRPGAVTTIVVTGVGAIIGQGIATSLRKSGRAVRIIGIDRNAEGLGRHWCDIFLAKPDCDEGSPDYLQFWTELLAREHVDLVCPGLEIDVFFLSGNRALLERGRTRLVLNNPELIALSRDKWIFGETLAALGLPAIPACLDGNWSDCIERLGAAPLLLKPRRGNGSRGIAVLRDEQDLIYWSRKSGGDFLIQKFVGRDDQEFTVGAFGLGDGTSLPPIIFRRRLSPAGNTQYAEVADQPVLSAAVAVIAAAFRPLGPTNYQFRMEGDTPYLLEINPRFSSSTSLRTAFGYNEASMAVEFYLDGRRPDEPAIRTGRGWRYSEDFVVG